MGRPIAARGEARQRVLEAALHLFAANGISGTSLQMIADHLGVTKAAVYYQFHSKEDIVLALVEPPMSELSSALDRAESVSDPARRVDLVICALVDLVVDNRQGAAVLGGDPGLTQILTTHESLQRITERFAAVTLGSDPGPADQVALAVLGSGLLVAGVNPDLAELDDATLRAELVSAGRRIMGLA